jgi:hypothetical protein
VCRFFVSRKVSKDPAEDPNAKIKNVLTRKRITKYFQKSKIFGYRGGTAEITSARQKKNLSEKSDAKIKQMTKISRGEYRPRRKLVGSEPMYKAQTVSKWKYGARKKLKFELILKVSVPEIVGEHRSSTQSSFRKPQYGLRSEITNRKNEMD